MRPTLFEPARAYRSIRFPPNVHAAASERLSTTLAIFPGREERFERATACILPTAGQRGTLNTHCD